MNHRILSGLTIAALTLTSLGVASASKAEQPGRTESNFATDTSSSEFLAEATTTASSSAGSAVSTPEAVKVGEYQSQTGAETAEENSIASIHPHELDGRQAATLYVRNIPVLTFLGPTADAQTQDNSTAEAGAEVKLATTTSTTAARPGARGNSQPTPATAADSSDPVWRATEVAARLNQYHRDSLDASDITVRWDAEQERYVIRIGNDELVMFDSDIILPDTTRDPAQDALQAANRLRRQMGNAEPLRDIEGRPRPRPAAQVTFGSVRMQITGMASWYGPGFHGRRSASGEVFNQNAMTAAHPHLPFGTQVRVTNLHNNQSVVVRINDRGPYAHGRVIDLSAAAANMVGLMQSGVAPVRIDVLGAAGTAN